MRTPSQRYAPSARTMPAKLAPIEYLCGDWVRKVDSSGWLGFKGRKLKFARALAGEYLAFRANPKADSAWDVYFCELRLCTIDLAEPNP